MSEKVKRPASLKDNIHKILHGSKEEKSKLQRSFFYIADTPSFLKELGLTGEYFSVKYGVISRHLRKDADHALGENDWLNLCKEITQPFAIARYGKGYRLFINVKMNGVFTSVGVDVKNVGKGLEVNSVATAFGYRGVLSDEDLIFIAKKLTPEQAALLEGLNFPQYPSKQGS